MSEVLLVSVNAAVFTLVVYHLKSSIMYIAWALLSRHMLKASLLWLLAVLFSLLSIVCLNTLPWLQNVLLLQFYEYVLTFWHFRLRKLRTTGFCYRIQAGWWVFGNWTACLAYFRRTLRSECRRDEGSDWTYSKSIYICSNTHKLRGRHLHLRCERTLTRVM